MKLKRPLRGSERGADVRMVQRALNKWSAGRYGIPISGVYDRRTSDRLMAFQAAEGVSPADGSMEQSTLTKLAPFFDLWGKFRYRSYRKPKPKLVEPRQGFASLHPSLHEAYSIGRRMGLFDLGTYNPASRLPGGGVSDHAVYPARAFDLGIDPDIGFTHPVGRKFFEAMVGRKEIEYVILGTMIWSRSRGLHEYTAGGHMNHVHVSGRWS